MKISKLFHWLYASLMFLPLVFIFGRSLYTIFNPNAKDSYTYDYSVKDIVYYNNTNNLQNGYTYYFSLLNDAQTGYSTSTGIITYSESNLVDILSEYYSGDLTTVDGFSLGYLYGYFQRNTLALYSGNTLVRYWSIGYDTPDYINSEVLKGIYFVFDSINTSYGNTVVDSWEMYQYVYGIKGTLDNSFINSLNELNTNPVFKWAASTYISEPLTYVTGLFGLEANNPINTLISYWFSVSIFWLVFDVMMYVPLLIHRWLDKAAIE